MEDILAVSKQPYDSQCPQVCVEEMSTQLIGETRAPLPAEPGKPLRYDTEYQVVEEFMALYYWGLRASTCEINQQIAS